MLDQRVHRCPKVKCQQRRNEITAISELLDLLDLRSCLVSIDAMGCQKAIAQKVIEKKGISLGGERKSERA